MIYTNGSVVHSGYRYMTDVLELQFPWQSLPREVLSPSSLTPREYKYLQWCLHSRKSLNSRNRRLLSLLGFLTYRQARWPTIRRKTWHLKTG